VVVRRSDPAAGIRLIEGPILLSRSMLTSGSLPVEAASSGETCIGALLRRRAAAAQVIASAERTKFVEFAIRRWVLRLSVTGPATIGLLFWTP